MASSFFPENTGDVSEPFASNQADLPADVVPQDSMPSSSNFESDNGVLSRSGVDENTPVGHRHQNRLAIRIPTRLPESTESTPAAALGLQGSPVQLHAIQLPARSAATPAPEEPSAEPSAPLSSVQDSPSPLQIQLPARLEVPAEFIDVPVESFDVADWLAAITSADDAVSKKIDVDIYSSRRMMLATINLAFAAAGGTP